jgi:thiamine-phosphate pyrophosphorylase
MALAGRPRGDFVLSTKVGRLVRPTDAIPPGADIDPQALDGREDAYYTRTEAVRLVFDYSADGVRRSIEESLERLGLDHVDIALLSKADGVHLGPDDLSIASALRLADGHLLVGASASTPETARAAIVEGADYLGSGPAFATPIKDSKPVIGPQGVLAVQDAVELPVFAIGGVAPANVEQLVLAGIRRACMIRALSEAADPAAVARQVRAALAT